MAGHPYFASLGVCLRNSLVSWNWPYIAHLAPGMPVEHSTALPVGLILPVTLAQTISVEHAQLGQPIEARIMQDVPLTLHDKIPAKSRISGAIVAVMKAADEHGVELSLRFDKIEINKDMIPTLSSLRVMASREAVRQAQTPLTGADGGTPTGWADTVQIGGDIRFGDSGKVRSRFKQTVGKGITGGVLVHLNARPGTDCDGPVNGDDRLQALVGILLGCMRRVRNFQGGNRPQRENRSCGSDYPQVRKSRRQTRRRDRHAAACCRSDSST